MHLALYIAVICIATGVIWTGSAWLESSSARLAGHYGLPPVVQGSVIAAVGSSFPEMSTTVIATLAHGEFDLGVSVIVGSAIFNILVIPGVAGLASGGLRSDRELVYKDAQFYLTSVAVLLLTFSLAVIYHPTGEAGGLSGEIDRPLALIPAGLYGLYIFLQHQETADYRAPAAQPTSPGRQWVLLSLGLGLIVGGVEALVRSAIWLGDHFGTPTFLWGLTVLAAATSLPDLFISLKAARRGQAAVSLGNVLGSNIFDLLVAVPAGVLIAGTATVDFAVAAPMMGVLTLATIVLFTMLRTRLMLTRAESGVLLALYAVFVGWMVLETLGVTRVVA
ncbi:MAG: sodium:calcium antiporter [Chromatiales bacterium]|jgi:cation:H+ antiporter